MPELPVETLFLLGASVRAAAVSARRAGFAVIAADLFADRDLQAIAAATRIESFPDDFTGLFQRGGPSWIYCGGLENYPSHLERWAKLAPLLGNSAETVRAVRDPLRVATMLRAAGVPVPEARLNADGLQVDGSWLRKPLRSAAGLNVFRWTGELPQPRSLAPASRGLERQSDQTQDIPLTPGPSPRGGARGDKVIESADAYFQRYIAGQSQSAVYVAAAGAAQLLGVTEQLIGQPSAPFAYRGSLGPLPLDAAALKSWQHIGIVLASEFNLVGLFGVDAIVNSDGIWPIEVNPRYTASIEIIEPSLAQSAIALHVAACRNRELPSLLRWADDDCWRGKMIVYSDADYVIDEDLSATNRADIPQANTKIACGQPILTVFASAADREQTIEQLEAESQRVLDQLQRYNRVLQ